MWPFKYPYTNFHELNLDWILSKIWELEQRPETPAGVGNNLFFSSNFIEESGENAIDSIIRKVDSRPCVLIVDADMNFTSRYIVPEYINILPAGGIIHSLNTVSIAGYIMPVRFEIFDGNFELGVKNTTGYPEMFSGENSVQACINVFTITELAAKEYRLYSPITIPKSGKVLRGSGSWASNGNYSRLVVNYPSNSAIVINTEGLENITIENLSIEYPSPSGYGVRALSIQKTAHSNIKNVSVYNACEAFFADSNINIKFDRCMAICQVTGDENYPAVGFKFGGNDGAFDSFVGENASLYCENCTFIGNESCKNSIGLIISNAPSDHFIDRFEASLCKTGIQITGTDGNNFSNNDIFIRECVIDRYYMYGIFMENVTPGTAVIENCYVCPVESPTEYTSGIHLTNCKGAIMVKNNIALCSARSTFSDKFRGIIATGCEGIIFDNAIKEHTIGIYLENCKCLNVGGVLSTVSNTSPSAGVFMSACNGCTVSFGMNSTKAYMNGVIATDCTNTVIHNERILDGSATNKALVNGAPTGAGQTVGSVRVEGF